LSFCGGSAPNPRRAQTPINFPEIALHLLSMRVTKWGEFGILCCLFLARKGSFAGRSDLESPDSANSTPIRSTGAAEIAQTHGLPLDYAQQILHRLRKGGVIASVRGPHGGFYLAKSPAQTSLKEILFAAEGDTFSVICEHNGGVSEGCGNSELECGLRSIWHELQDVINQFLSARNLQDLIDRENASGRKQIFSELVPGPSHLQRNQSAISPLRRIRQR